MRRRHFIYTLMVGATFQSLEKAYGKRSNHWNVLFIAIDDCKPMLGCYGDTFVKSPNIDRLAAQGTVFLNNHCQWAVCGPSRASLMSSMMPETTGVMGFKPMRGIIPDLVTLPQHFRANGYETAATGKLNDPRCVEGGRVSDDEPSWSIPYRKYAQVGIYKPAKKRSCEASAAPEEDHEDSRICDAGLKLMQELAKGKKPFFLGVGFKKPHLPFIAPKKYWDLYDRKKIPLAEFQEEPKNGTEYTWNHGKETRSYDDIPDKGPIPKEKQTELVHGYYACVSFIDNLVGKLLGELKKLKLEKNTIVVLWGDHGFHLGDHGEWGKHTNMEQATRSPLIISVGQGAGGVECGIKTQNPTGFIDIYPTLCELAGLEIPAPVQGRSLVPMLGNPASKVRNGAISLFRRGGAIGYAYRTERYRYIEWISRGEVVARELYDYEKDPLEKVNLAADERTKPLMKTLAKQLREEGIGCKLLMKAEE